MSATQRTTLTDDDLWEVCKQCQGTKKHPLAASGAMMGGQCAVCQGCGRVPTETAKAIIRLIQEAQRFPGLF